MVEVERFGTIIDVCRTCHGTWLDIHELEKIADTGARQLAQHKISRCGSVDREALDQLFTRQFKLPDENPLRFCPCDGSELIHKDRHGITIDWCPLCRGIWLDRGELDAIIHATAHRLCLSATPDTLATAPLPLISETDAPQGHVPGMSGLALVYQKTREVHSGTEHLEYDEMKYVVKFAGKAVQAHFGAGFGLSLDDIDLGMMLSLATRLLVRFVRTR